MKKIIVFLLITILAVATFAGCDKENIASSDGKINIVTTIFPAYDFTRTIAGDSAEISMLLPPGAETHSFEPTPKDIIKIQNCDVFIYVGGESDDWVKGVLDSMDTSKIKIITLIDCVELVEEKIVDGMQGEEESDEVEYDEHVWTSPRNAKLIVEKISEVLCSADIANAADYKINTADELVKLDKLDSEFKAVVATAKRKTIVFGDRFPFRYFADAYGLDYFAAFPGCSTETEASAKTVAFLIDKIKAENIPVVFYIELSNEKMADSISESTGAKVLLLHSCHNITKVDFTAGKTYIDFMADNVIALREALS